MSDSFRIEFNWLPREHEDPAERVTLADLSIFIKEQSATELEDLLAKTVRKFARLSAHNLALWIASNWWRLRWEPERNTSSWQMSHKLGAAGGGYVWPDLAFISVGDAVLIRSRPTPAWNAQPVRYLNDFDIAIPADDFEIVVNNFIDAVIARLSSEGKVQSDLPELWKEVLDERQNPEDTRWRKLEAFMGFDPDEAPAKLIKALQSEATSYGESAIEEIAAASKAQALLDLKTLNKYARQNSVPASLTKIDLIRSRIDKEVPSSQIPTPWKRGEQVAKIAREIWSLEQGPVQTEALFDHFKIASSSTQEPNNKVTVPMSAGFRDSNSEDIFHVYYWNKRHLTTQRFALARLVGDHLVSQENERLLPATNEKTSRQKFQRAFAQEFLCPFDDLRKHLDTEQPSDEDIEEAAEHFIVSPLFIKTTLVNKRLLEREAIDT